MNVIVKEVLHFAWIIIVAFGILTIICLIGFRMGQSDTLERFCHDRKVAYEMREVCSL